MRRNVHFMMLAMILAPALVGAGEQAVRERLLGVIPAGGPDTNADHAVDAADLIAARSLPANAVSFQLVAPAGSVFEEEEFVVSVIVHSPVEALGSYRIRILYPSDVLFVTDVEDGADPLIGTYTVANNQPEFGWLTIEGEQFASLDGPTGAVEVARIRFLATSSGAVTLRSMEGRANDVAQFPLRVRELPATDVQIEVVLPPD